MNMPLKGRVVAIVGSGTPNDRAIAVALAEAGAAIAIATERQDQREEFATASIANEVWAIGREQWPAVIDSNDDDELRGFFTGAREHLGGLDVVLAPPHVALAARDRGLVAVAVEHLDGSNAVDQVLAALLG